MKPSHEYQVIALRECPVGGPCETPGEAAAYWRDHIASQPGFDPEKEHLAVLILNTRRRIKGHQIVAIGTQNSVLTGPREVFRLAVAAAAAAIILIHNHPSGDSSPSEADIRITRELIRAGSVLGIEFLDHLIIGSDHTSLKNLGCA